MLMRILANSEISESLEESYGLDYVAKYSIPGNSIAVASRDPFKKGDVLDLEVVHGHPILMGGLAHEADTDRTGIGFLVPLSTNIPLHIDSDYKFEVSRGVDLLLAERSVHKKSPLVSYLLAIRSIGPDFKIRGIDETTGSEIAWFVSLVDELERYGH